MKIKIRKTAGESLLDIPTQDANDIHIFIGDQSFRLKESDNSLYLTVDGHLIIWPKSSNGIYINEKGW